MPSNAAAVRGAGSHGWDAPVIESELRACPQILEMPSSAAAVRGGRSQGWRSPPGLSERSRMRSERAAELDGISKICPRQSAPGARYTSARHRTERQPRVEAAERE